MLKENVSGLGTQAARRSGGRRLARISPSQKAECHCLILVANFPLPLRPECHAKGQARPTRLIGGKAREVGCSSQWPQEGERVTVLALVCRCL
jgi:hypothetical protein